MTGIAVTKNFVASPHIDDRDVSHQFCVSLGSFTEVRSRERAGYNDTGNASDIVVTLPSPIKIKHAKIIGRNTENCVRCCAVLCRKIFSAAPKLRPMLRCAPAARGSSGSLLLNTGRLAVLDGALENGLCVINLVECRE